MLTPDEFETYRQVQRDWLRSVCDQMGWTPTKLAREIGVAQTTINRPLNNKVTFLTSTTTILKIVRRTGIAAPPELLQAPAITDPELMLIALRETRAAVDDYRFQTDSERERFEAKFLSELYDVLTEAVIAGRSPEEAAQTIRAQRRRESIAGNRRRARNRE